MNAGLRLVDKAAAWTGLLAYGLQRSRRGLTILMYHRVLPAEGAGRHALRNLIVSEECFEKQVKWLVRRMDVVTLGQGLQRLRDADGKSARPMVALTFDDGYDDNAQYAAPIMEAHGVRATFFVTTGFIQGRAMWFDRATKYYLDHREATVEAMIQSGVLAGGDPAAAHEAAREAVGHLRSVDSWLGWLKAMTRADREQTLAAIGAVHPAPGCKAMTPEQVIELSKRGHEIGSHTVTHPILIHETAESRSDELETSRRQIEQWTGKPVPGFCYPNGLGSEVVAQAAMAVGHSYAVTTQRGIATLADDPMMLPRRWISPDSTTHDGKHSDSAFAAEVLGLHDFIRDKTGRRRGPSGVPPRRPIGDTSGSARRTMRKAA